MREEMLAKMVVPVTTSLPAGVAAHVLTMMTGAPPGARRPRCAAGPNAPTTEDLLTRDGGAGPDGGRHEDAYTPVSDARDYPCDGSRTPH